MYQFDICKMAKSLYHLLICIAAKFLIFYYICTRIFLKIYVALTTGREIGISFSAVRAKPAGLINLTSSVGLI